MIFCINTWRREFYLVACVYLWLSAVTSVWASSGDSVVNPSLYAEALKCGPNSLLAFLILAGRPETLAQELENIELGHEGASLLSLRNAARKLGVETEVRRYRVEDIDLLPLPAIVQFTNSSYSVFKGHFVVIYKIDREHFYLIDGTTGFRDRGLKSRLPAFWTGYALTKKTFGIAGRGWLLNVVFVMLLLMECAILTGIISYRRNRDEFRSSEKTKTEAGIDSQIPAKDFQSRGSGSAAPGPRLIFFGVSFLLLSFSQCARADAPVSNAWRCAANGGVNVLYCYLAANGKRCDYRHLVNEQAAAVGTGPYTMSTLADLSARHGLPLRAVRLKMDELRSCLKPVIVHMDGESPEAGAFLLILNLTDRVFYVNGPSATVHEMSLENFRRVWSGVALLHSADGSSQTVICLAAFVTGLIIPGVRQRWISCCLQKARGHL